MSLRFVSTFACAPALVCLAGVAFVVGCDGSNVGENETIGREGLVKFGADSKLVFSQRIVTGSAFEVTFAAVDANETNLAGATLRSSDEDVLTVAEGASEASGAVTMAGPGTASVEVVQDGAVVDAIELHSGKAGATALVDGALFATTDTVDARLPAVFAIQTDSDHQLLVTAVDKCGGDLIDLGASTLETADGVPASIEVLGPAQFSVTTQVAGDVSLVLKTPGLDDLVYDVKSVDPGQVDEVTTNPTAQDEAGNITMWGRAFVDDVELIGALTFSWAADPRVTLSAVQGTLTSALVSFPLEGEPPDDRPAVVSAEIFGESGGVDLLSPSTTIISTRGAPARELVVEEQTPSCQGGEQTACDPEAALLLILGARGLRRLRHARLLRALREVPRG